MERTVYINGALLPKSKATVSVFDHGLLYGDGIFEGLRSYGGRVFRLKEHIDRLYDSAKAIWLTIPMAPQAMADAVEATVAANKITDGYIRLVVTRGAGPLGLDPRTCSEPQIIIIADSITMYPQEYYDKGLAIITSSVLRNHPAALSPRIKSLNYLNNILAKIEGIQAGCIEALMLNHKGEVAECTGDNIFIRNRAGRWLTPSLESGILDGITRQVVLELIEADGQQPALECPLTKHDLYIAQECFLTGTAAEVIPVVKIDSRSIGEGIPGPGTRRLIEQFHAATRA